MAQQGGNFRLSDAGTAADGDDNPSVDSHLGRHGYQQRENGVGLCNMVRANLDLVSGHIPVGNIPSHHRRTPMANGG